MTRKTRFWILSLMWRHDVNVGLGMTWIKRKRKRKRVRAAPLWLLLFGAQGSDDEEMREWREWKHREKAEWMTEREADAHWERTRQSDALPEDEHSALSSEMTSLAVTWRDICILQMRKD